MRRGGPLKAGPSTRRRRAYVARVRDVGSQLATHDSDAVGRTLAGVHLALAAALGVPPREGSIVELAGDATPVSPDEVEPPPGLATPALLGVVHEALRAPSDRKAAGAVYTDPAVAARVVEWALSHCASRSERTVTVCDPAVGGGVFLLAAADALVAQGQTRAGALDLLFGADVDALAVAVARAALTLWSGAGRPPDPEALVVDDALALTTNSWSSAPAAGFDIVVGNPPFRGQLQSATARRPAEHAAAKELFGAAAAPYADVAALFLLHGCDLARSGGVVAMLQPESFLAARDAGGARTALLERASLRGLWLAGGGLFDAGVRVCVPLLVVDGRPSRIELRTGPAAIDAGTADARSVAQSPTWAHLAAEAAGTPAVSVNGGRSLADFCQATADFRDQYYGLLPALVEAADSFHPRVVTCGLLEPAVSRWGERPARIGRRTFITPSADLAVLAEQGLAEWSRKRLVPKVLVATQTRVIEAAVDETGAWLPSTPVITVTCPPERLWHVAAVLLSPVASAWSHRHYRGVALSADTLKLSARQVLEIPIPADGPDWDEAAVAVRRAAASTGDAWRAALLDAGAASSRAYGVEGDELVAWWSERLPAWR